MKHVPNPTASAADDRAVEDLLDVMPADDLFELATYAAAWDEEHADGVEEERNRLALVRPRIPLKFLIPIDVALGLLILLWLVL